MSNVVFFSGGLDSTLVALQLLRAEEHVKLVTFDNCWIGGEHQQNLEKIQRKKILQRMKTEFGDNKITLANYTWDGELKGAGMQSNVWVSLFPLALEDKDKAYFGIIRYSDFWHVREKWEKAFNAILDCQGKKYVKLEYPLEWWKKHEIIKKLKKYGYHDLAIHSGDKLG